ncbi:MAG TPA: hypothetical protein VGH43_11365 [Jatrophihabitans sp.]
MVTRTAGPEISPGRCARARNLSAANTRTAIPEANDPDFPMGTGECTLTDAGRTWCEMSPGVGGGTGVVAGRNDGGSVLAP